MHFPLRQARCRQCVVRAHLLQQAKRKCKGWQQKMPRRRWMRSTRGARGQGSLTAQEGRDAAASKHAREREQGSQTSSGPAGMPKTKKAGTLGRMVTRNTQPMPLTSWPAASCASLRQVPTDSINVPLTKSRRMRKDEGKPGGKTADKLGWVVVRNTQPMPLTSWRAARCASLRQAPHGEYQLSTHKIATRPQR